MPKPEANHANKIFTRYLIFLLICFLALPSLSACIPQASLRHARNCQAQSQSNYRAALKGFQSLIQKGRNLDQLYFELGQLYYNHGEFELAAEEFKRTNDPRAGKLLGICYWRLGDFTDALEILGKHQEGADDESLYYYALASEKLSLFDQATKALQKIKTQEFSPLALARLAAIKKEGAPANIKDISPAAYKLLAQDLSLKQYPQAGALILACQEKIEITAQGTQVSELHYLIKILNERGKEEFSEAHIEYDSTYEKVELEYARTIKPDGTVIDIGKQHIRDVSLYLNFPLYSNARVYIISFPDVVEDAGIEYKIKIHRNQLINKKDFVLSYPVQASEPIIQADFEVTVPKEKGLQIKILNSKFNNFGSRLEPDLEDRGSSLIYRWKFKDIPQIIPEANMPPGVEIAPTIILSTFKSWQDIYAWWWALAKDKISADDAIVGEVKRLTGGLNSDEEKARAIYNFCARKIRYVAVEYGQAGYEPHKAEDIFKNKYGDCKDQSILLITMLRQAGFSAWPVLISTKEYYDLNPEFPSVLFNHCIAAVSLKDKVIFLDPTCETCSFDNLPSGDQERRVLVFRDDSPQIMQTPLYPARHNLVKQVLDINMSDNESIKASKSVFTEGVYDQAQRNWLLYTPPELIVAALQEKIQDVSIGARLGDYSIKNLEDLNTPVTLNYAFSGPEYLTLAGNLRILPGLAGLDTSLVAKEKRKYPIYLPFLDAKENIFEIAIPENFVIKYMPESVAEDSSWLAYSTEYDYRQNKIYFKQKVELKKNRILETEYLDFKVFFEALAKKVKQRIILERIS